MSVKFRGQINTNMILAELEKYNISLEKFSEICGYDIKEICKVLNNSEDIKFEVIQRIAKVLGVPVIWLYIW